MAKLRSFTAKTAKYDRRGTIRSLNSSAPAEFPPGSGETDLRVNQGIVGQLETIPITQNELINEVREIFNRLVMKEKNCIDIVKEQSESKTDPTESQWQRLISMHQKLLYEYYDFLDTSHQPTASPVLKQLAEKYQMPGRMWRHGIYSFLELLRKKLPKSLDYVLDFIYFAYPIITLLFERVLALRRTWIRCLGDLARYRMAIEQSDMKDREVWAGVARYWYHLDADQSPNVGRIQHHLGITARPDSLQQLFYYTKALVSVQPFQNARESIVVLFNSYKAQPINQHTLITAFIATHEILFSQDSDQHFFALAHIFLSHLRREIRWHLRREIRWLDRKGQQGVWILCCNFAAMLEYGKVTSTITLDSAAKQDQTLVAADTFALKGTSGLGSSQTSASALNSMSKIISHPMSLTTVQGSCLTFSTINVFLDHMDDPGIYPSIHTSLAFLWLLSFHTSAIQSLETSIPWLRITQFLNTLFKPELNFEKIEGETFPYFEGETLQQLPEDFLIRGQSWSQSYYPDNFFEDASSEDNSPVIEGPTTVILRRHRCLWLGVQIARFNRWISYSRDGRFTPIQLRYE